MFQLLMPKKRTTRSLKLVIETGTSLCAAMNKGESSDVPYVSDLPPYFMLADGEGGEDHGVLAGALATRRMQRCLEEAWSESGRWRWPLSWGPAPKNVNPDAPEIVLNHARNLMHEYFLSFKERHKEFIGISVALTTAFIAGTTLYASHTGSNRIYICRENDLQRVHIGSSHAMIGDVQSHIDYLESPACDRFPFLVRRDLKAGDRLLLCTKGIGALTYQDIHNIMMRQEQSAGELAEALIGAVQAKGPIEDTAVLIVCVSQGCES